MNWKDLNDKQKMKVLQKEYSKELRSYADIAEKYGTYPNKIRRDAKKLGSVPRNKSEAQIASLAIGNSQHPTEGRIRSADERIAISEATAKKWRSLTKEQIKSRQNTAKRNWEKLTFEQKDRFRQASIDAIHLAAAEGSKLEKSIVNKLKDEGYIVEQHKKGLVPNHKLEVDIYLPDVPTVIEIDGPSHFEPVWGEVAFQRTVRADNEKNGLLRSHGIMVIRVKQLRGTISQKDMRDAWIEVSKTLNKIWDKLPSKNKRFVEIEI